MAFCIRPELAAQLKDAAKAGEITMQKLFEMSSEERSNVFGKYTDSGTAKEINAGFEKAMASSQQSVLNNWVKRTFTAVDQKSGRKADVISKINDLQKQGVLDPKSEKAYLSDLVATKMGATITADEAKVINEKSIQLQELQSKITGLGDPEANKEEQVAYLQARDKMNKYLESLTPSSGLKVFTSTIGRGMMVATLHSPVLNVISHGVIGVTEAIGRRVSDLNFRTLNDGYARAYISHANKIFDKTGYDLSRFDALGGEKKSMGEDYVHSQGAGVVHKIGQITEDAIFKNLHGNIYERFAAVHFADSANLKTSAIAFAEGLKGDAAKARAKEIFKDAVLTEPTTDMGRMVRAQAQADALYSTFTNKSAASEAALGIRKVVNTGTGDYRVGDLEIPFAKTPANVLQTQLESSGIFVPPDILLRGIKTLNDMHQGVAFTDAAKQNFATINKALTRAGIGMTFAYLASTIINPSDFIGAYPTDPKEQQLLSERNGVANSIRVGGHWVSLDYLGPLGASLLGFLYAKKYGAQTPLDFVYRYGQGATQPLQNLPGLQEIAAVYKYLNTPPNKKTDAKAFATTEGKSLLGQLTARIIPGFISDIAKMTDQYNRSVNKNSIFAQVQSNIPGLREGLPIAHDIFGDTQTTEHWASTLLFGARVKTAADGQLINELVRLHENNALPAITNVAKTSSTAKALQVQIGDTKFQQAMTDFGKQMKSDFIDQMNSDDYKSVTDPEKQAQLDKIKASDFKQILDDYGYEKPEKP